MSRIGRKPIVIPAGVEVTINGSDVTVKGPKGTLNSTFHPMIKIEKQGEEVIVTRPNDEKEARSLHGLTRTLISNMVLVMNLGYSHQVIVPEEGDITIEVPDPNKIIIHGIDKQHVGQFAAQVREKRPPEPYKGKGIRYVGEFVAHKEGKAGKGAK